MISIIHILLCSFLIPTVLSRSIRASIPHGGWTAQSLSSPSSPIFQPVVERPGCISLKTPEGDKLISCPQCKAIEDQEGNKVVLGSGCGHTQEKVGTEARERCSPVGLPSRDEAEYVDLANCFGCKSFVDQNENTHIQCPGCDKYLNKFGQLIMELGPRCREYEIDVPRFGEHWAAAKKHTEEKHTLEHVEGKDKYENCTVVKSGDKTIVAVCPGCTLIIDDGEVNLKIGKDCDKYTSLCQEESSLHHTAPSTLSEDSNMDDEGLEL